MSQPAEVTSTYDWERLNAQLANLVLDIEDIWEQITDPDRNSSEPEEPVPADDPDRGYDLDRDAELEDKRRRRLDFETDGELDGDYDPTPPYDPELDT